MPCARKGWLVMLCWGALACSEQKARLVLPNMTQQSGIEGAEDAGPQHVVACDGASNGTPCGDPGSRTLCIFGVCQKSVCGDGYRASNEDCDDGNQRNGDGCSAQCKKEPAPGCGNGVVEAHEECDDGNTSDDDQCTHLCTNARCGDRIVSRGEQCDDGNLNNNDGCNDKCEMTGTGGMGGGSGAGGSGGSHAPTPSSGGSGTSGGAGQSGAAGGSGSDASGNGAIGSSGNGASGSSGQSAAGSTAIDEDGGVEPYPSDACKTCREMNCRNYMGSGLDLIAGCYETVNTDLASMSDPMFIQHCVDVVACAHANGCAYDMIAGLSGCYCGAETQDQCVMSGPAQNGTPRCVTETQAAAESMVNDDVVSRFTDFTYPLGWANSVLACDRDSCMGAGQCVQ